MKKNRLILNKYCIFLIFFSFLAFKNTASAFSNDFENLTIKMPDQEISVPESDFEKWLTIKPSLVYDSSYNSEIENTEYCTVSKIICSLLETEKIKHSFKKIESVALDKKKVTNFLDDLARKYNKEPLDSTFTVTDGKVTNFSLSQNGYKLDVEKS
ncbi:MAG: hypothetical protein UR60_C0044G0001, partial [Candidatus Moranbacteria bacterium GW2011_GWF2_34_56]